ncbi:acyl-CoA N-acyltransferase [Xylariomycetidae sp. FL0641]|nr:acyl-CoA N-acyltransferase [Xylariomycetidae sp. FL0641]
MDAASQVSKGLKRGRRVTDPIELANAKSDEIFIKEHFVPSDPSWNTWTNPQTKDEYSVSLTRAGSVAVEDLKACFDLIEETSRAAYEPSSVGWKPKKKLAEMKSPELRYILVKDNQGSLRGFTSLMPTYEEGEPVVYCYEIHLKPELRGTGLAQLLMSHLERVAVNTPPIKKVMLTCFVTNEKAMSFYKKFGFQTDAISPEPRKLRFGKIFVPDYTIMSKVVTREIQQDAES